MALLKSILRYLICLFIFAHFPFTESEGTAQSGEKSFEIMTRDSILLEVNLISDSTGRPDHYQSYVETPVCDDGLCKLMSLDVHWDLLGNFQCFNTLPGRPLTKWDHLEFSDEDYRKLDEILADQRSLLGSVKDVNDLFDANTQKVSETVDAVTGATRETVINAVVPGAVYSSYTMWHIVNGPIKQRISQSIADLISTALFRKFLLSDNHNYHYYALQHLSEDQMGLLTDELLLMLKSCSPFVRKNAIFTLPVSVLEAVSFQSSVVGLWTEFDYYSQEALLDRLKMIDMQEASLNQIIAALPSMNEFQMGRALDLLRDNRDRLEKSAMVQIGAFMETSEPPISNCIYNFLIELSESKKEVKKILKQYEKADL